MDLCGTQPVNVPPPFMRQPTISGRTPLVVSYIYAQTYEQISQVAIISDLTVSGYYLLYAVNN